MSLHCLAVGTKMPVWVQQGVDEYSRRLPRELKLQWQEVRAETRRDANSAHICRQREAQRIRRALPKNPWLVVLDEKGETRTTEQLSRRLAYWQTLGRPVCVLIGGADGLDDSLKSAAGESLRLSSLTLPHALVRVVLAEQLYRAWTILTNHPYHRA